MFQASGFLCHMASGFLLQVMGCPLPLWVIVCSFTWQLMGSRHLLNKDLCALHLANVTLRILSGSLCQQNFFVGVSVQFLANFWSLPLQLFYPVGLVDKGISLATLRARQRFGCSSFMLLIYKNRSYYMWFFRLIYLASTDLTFYRLIYLAFDLIN